MAAGMKTLRLPALLTLPQQAVPHLETGLVLPLSLTHYPAPPPQFPDVTAESAVWFSNCRDPEGWGSLRTAGLVQSCVWEMDGWMEEPVCGRLAVNLKSGEGPLETPTLSTWETPKAWRSEKHWFGGLLVVPAHPPGLT